MRAWLGALALLIAACQQEPVGQPTPVAPVPDGPVAWLVSAQASKTELQVGETLDVEITVRHPAGQEFLIATGANLEPFELVERVDAEPSSPVEDHVTLRLAAYRLPGEIAVPPIKVEYRNESGELASLETEPIPITLVTSLTPAVTDIHDIKPPIADIPISREWGWLWWVLGALGVAAIAYLLYRRFTRKRPESMAATPPPPLLPPEVEAETALRRLAEAGWLKKGEVHRFYIELSEIMKRYAGRRYGVPFLERTTPEIQKDLKRTGIPREAQNQLDRILVTADFVKFARVIPPEEESNRMVPESFRFIEETKPLPLPPALEEATVGESSTRPQARSRRRASGGGGAPPH
jgi:hypothetical protein